MKQSERERLLAETLEHLMTGGDMNFHLSTGEGFLDAQEIALSEDLVDMVGRKEIYNLCRACFWLGSEANEFARRGKSAYTGVRDSYSATKTAQVWTAYGRVGGNQQITE